MHRGVLLESLGLGVPNLLLGGEMGPPSPRGASCGARNRFYRGRGPRPSRVSSSIEGRTTQVLGRMDVLENYPGSGKDVETFGK